MTDLAVPKAGLRYRPIMALGQGGMAAVHLAVARGPGGFNKLLVLKTLRDELVQDDQMRQLFLAEARLSARLNHPNVVQVYEIIDAARLCIVMEYLEGQAISDVQRIAGPNFSTAMQLRVISDVLAGLHYSHELCDYDGTPLNIVHRDVSPQNVFITYDGIVKVLDFGIAKANTEAGGTAAGVMKGKICYMPREQMLAEAIDRRADVYAVGCMLWHAATHIKLWSGVPEGTIMRRMIDGDIPTPSSCSSDVDPRLERIVMKALAPEPAERFPTALDLRIAIDAYLEDTHPDCTMGDVATFVSELFAEDRRARSKTIHSSLTRAISGPPPAMVSMPGPSATPMASATVIDTGTGSGLRGASAPSAVRIAALTAGLLVVAGGVYGWRSAASHEASTFNAVASDPPRSVEIHLSVVPRSARITMDGKPVASNPAVLQVERDGLEHEIQADAAGYAPARRSLRFERDLSVELMLEKAADPDSLALDPSPPRLTPESLPRSSKSVKADGHGRSNAAKSKTQPQQPAQNCDPPFFFEHGIKTYKPECI